MSSDEETERAIKWLKNDIETLQSKVSRMDKELQEWMNQTNQVRIDFGYIQDRLKSAERWLLVLGPLALIIYAVLFVRTCSGG